jgi:transposase
MMLTDARKLTQDAQEALRLRAVKMVVQDNISKTQVARLLGVSRRAVINWCTKYEDEGKDSLHKRKRGPKPEAMSRLKPWQCANLVNIIRDNCPDQLKMPFMLWTREAVQMLIETKFGIKLSIRSVGNYLQRWGFTVQKPIRRAYERQDSAVQKWLAETYPEIANRAKKEKGEIHWGDEAGFRSDHQSGTTYSPRGKTPVIKGTGKRFRVNMISTVTNKGTLRFMIYEESFTAGVFIKFLKRLVRSSSHKIFLIVDNLPVHHSKIVKEWVKSNSKTIEIFYLPAYSPELNPDELLNQDVKTNAVGRKRAKSLSELKANLRAYLFGTQKSKELVQAYFHKKEVAYAA